jgi:hypothetical protein
MKAIFRTAIVFFVIASILTFKTLDTICLLYLGCAFGVFALEDMGGGLKDVPVTGLKSLVERRIPTSLGGRLSGFLGSLLFATYFVCLLLGIRTL